MKRLTISMSDELFKKLDRIENKSLFIRKLVERELETLEDTPETSNKPWVHDFTILKENVDEIFLKLTEFEKHLTGKITLSPDSEPSSDILPSGSLISYKDRPLASNIGDDIEPIIIPISEKSIALPCTVIPDAPAEIPEFEKKEIHFRISETTPGKAFNGAMIHDIVQNPPEEPVFDQPEVFADSNQPEYTFAQAPLENTEPEVPPIISEFKQKDINANGSIPMMPELTQQVTPASDTTPIMPTFEKQVIPISKPAPVMPAFEQQAIPISEPVPVTPAFEQHIIPTREQVPVMPAFNQHLIPVSEPKPTMPIFNQNALPVSESAPIVPTFNQHSVPAGEPAPVIPAFNQQVIPVSEPAPIMPVFEQQTKSVSEPSLVMPEFKPQAMEEQGTQIVMQEFKMPGDMGQIVPAMPSFDTKSETAPHGDLRQPLFRLHEIAEPLKTEKMPPFIAPPILDVQENVQSLPFMETQPAAMPQVQQQSRQSAQNTAKPGKLEGNILMYMPRGAKVKKEIIKSLISKQFSEGEIEAKISELVSAGVLRINADSGNQYLIRP
ncbi:hypothetical protein Mpsy_2832 [Methanolobus psychrophilus R15]|nr:hypothetical protein Mpsy_2832 [Methanolobus psychrophilus R15]